MPSKQAHKQKSQKKVTTTQSNQQKFLKYSSFLLMPALLLAWCVGYYSVGGEIIGLNRGFGWDGVTYGSFAYIFDTLLATPVLDPYLAQRVLPSGLIHYALPFLGIDLDSKKNILQAFIVLNTICVTVSGGLWAAIAAKLRLSLKVQWLGFIALFCNCAVMKMSVYYPPLTDVPAFFLSMLALLCYVYRFQTLLYLVSALAYFTFPTGFYICSVLIILPFAPLQTHNRLASTSTDFFDKRIPIVITSVAILVAGAFIWYFAFFKKVVFPGTESIFEPTLLIAIPLMLGYIGGIVWIVSSLLPWQYILNILKDKFFWVRVGSVGLLWGFLLFCRIHFLQNPDPRVATPMNVQLFFGGSFSLSIAKPLLPFVSHVVYFGPMVILVALFFRSIIQSSLQQTGLGIVVVITITALMSGIMSESRQLINLIPFMMFGVAVAMSGRNVQRWHIGVVAVVGIFCSKCWVQMNYPDIQTSSFLSGKLVVFPAQWYFMNFGPWMSMVSYVWQISIITVIGLAYAFIFLRSK
ncbi:MAG: hypothetical protein EAZ92_10315 [Candidatus Kapaibacterium sp.]|nr:MAG: hypothetical protein EAZ92_10315 [Candidatus Kapabacteria bacterium]